MEFVDVSNTDLNVKLKVEDVAVLLSPEGMHNQ